MLEREWSDADRQKIRKAAEAMKSARKDGKVLQRTLARSLVGFIDRSEASIYGEIRRMMRTGKWWSHIPVSTQL